MFLQRPKRSAAEIALEWLGDMTRDAQEAGRQLKKLADAPDPLSDLLYLDGPVLNLIRGQIARAVVNQIKRGGSAIAPGSRAAVESARNWCVELMERNAKRYAPDPSPMQVEVQRQWLRAVEEAIRHCEAGLLHATDDEAVAAREALQAEAAAIEAAAAQAALDERATATIKALGYAR